jgi:hypothetical protein
LWLAGQQHAERVAEPNHAFNAGPNRQVFGRAGGAGFHVGGTPSRQRPRVLSRRAPDLAKCKQVVSPLQGRASTVGSTNSGSPGIGFRAAGTTLPRVAFSLLAQKASSRYAQTDLRVANSTSLRMRPRLLVEAEIGEPRSAVLHRNRICTDTARVWK